MEDNINFSKWLNQHFPPCGYVYSTEAAKEILRKNNLTPSEFLRPFVDFKSQSIHATIGDHGVTMTDFRLDFFDNEDCYPIKTALYYDYASNVLSNPNICPQEIRFSRESIKGLSTKIRNCNFVWMKEFESTFIECLRFNESELYQQPLCNVYVVSSKDSPSVIGQLSAFERLPSLVKSGLYDNPAANLIVILNDRTNAPVDKEACAQAFKAKYNNTHYIMSFDINKAEEEGGTTTEIWSNYFHRVDQFNPKSKKELKIYGAYIAKSEIVEYKKQFYCFVVNYLFSQIREIVTRTENMIKDNKSFLGWLDKSEPKGDYVESFRVFKLKDIDKKRYTLGMIYFFFRYYEEAYRTLNKLKGDIKGKTYPTYTNALYQLCVITQFMTGKTNELDQAFKHYHKNAQFPLALRALFIEIYMNDSIGKGDILPQLIKNAKDQLPRIGFDALTDTNKEDLNSFLVPLFNEKAAMYALLAAKQHRKFFRSMIQAGFGFAAMDREDMVYYAINCFVLFYQFIDNISPSFARLKESLNAKLGELCTKIKYPEAYRFYKNCIELSKYSPNKFQDQYLRDFFLSTNQAKSNTNRLGIIDNSSFSIPEIDNTTVLIIEEPDYRIASISKDNVAFKSNRWMYFNKYSVVNKKRTHATFSEMDTVILKILDKMSTEANCSNFYARRSFRGNVGEKVYVCFRIKNPLNVEIQISVMKLFGDFVPEVKEDPNATVPSTSLMAVFKRDVEYQNVQMSLPPNTSRMVELYLKPLVSGQCTVKGVEIVLSKVIEIRHYFNQKNMSRFYAHRTKRLPSTVVEAGRRSSVSSHNSSVLSEGSGHKKTIFSHKADILYEAVNEAADISINFPKGFDIELYENELFLMPIAIINNSSYRIKRFSVFTSDLNSEGGRSQALYCENIYRQMDFYNQNNKVDILAPFLPLMSGTIYLKVIIKFEDELKQKQIPIRRFIVKINVIPSIGYVINEEIVKITSTNETDKTINFNLNSQVFIEDRTALSKLLMGSISHSNDYSINAYSDWKIISNDSYDKYYNSISMTNAKQTSKEHKSSTLLKGLGGLTDCLSEEVLSAQPHIAKKLIQVLNGNMLFFNWSACDKSNRVVEGIMLYQTSLSIPKTSAKFIKTVLSNCINLKTEQVRLDEEQTMVTIAIEFNKENLIEIYDINYYEFFVDCKDQNLTWLGLNRYTIANQKITNVSNVIKLEFAFVTTLKGDLTMNYISMAVYLKKKDPAPLILNEIPHPFIITIS